MLSVRQEAELVPALRRTLTSVFEPSGSVETTTGDLVEIRDNGQALVVPLLGTRRGVRLEHAHGGPAVHAHRRGDSAARPRALRSRRPRPACAGGRCAHGARAHPQGHSRRPRGQVADAAAPGRRQRACVGTRSHQGSARTARRARDFPVPSQQPSTSGEEYEDRCRDAHVRLLWRENGHPGDVERWRAPITT